MNRTAAAPLLDERPADPGVKDVQLVPTTGGDVVHLFERLATDPNASVEKIERLMALWERGEARKAELAFNAAMAAAQAEMRPVVADAFNPQTRSKYASFEALDTALRPIYSKHGLALSFDTGDTAPDTVRVLCYVTHAGGHSRTYKADMPADGKGAKGGDVMTKTHAVASAMSYGMRYLEKMIFNVAVGEDDDDGNRAAHQEQSTAPDGYDPWFATLEGIADEGMKSFSEKWNKSPEVLRRYLASTAPKVLAALRNKAAKVKG